MSPEPLPAAPDLLQTLSTKSAQQLDEVYDYFKLLGIVLGQFALLEVVTDQSKDPKALSAKVAAARALTQIKESPDSIADRLRRSQFADLTPAELQTIVHQLRESGPKDLPAIIAHIKKDRQNDNPPSGSLP